MMTLRTSRVEKRSPATRYRTPNGLVLGIPRPIRSHHVPLQRNIRHVLLAKQNRKQTNKNYTRLEEKKLELLKLCIIKCSKRITKMFKTGERGRKTINFTQRKSEPSSRWIKINYILLNSRYLAAKLLREMLIGQTVFQKEAMRPSGPKVQFIAITDKEVVK